MKISFTFVTVIVCIKSCLTADNNFEEVATLEEKYGKVIHASVIFRHGDRTPIASYPLDPYKDYVWPEGSGQLTNAGKQRMYNSGKWFKKRYANLVNEEYFHEDIKMESSDYDRCIMSAACFLAGFYPISEFELWNNDSVKWQPIPVHSIPLEKDNMISMYQNCEVYNYELFAAGSEEEFKQCFRIREEFFTHVGKNTGYFFSEHFTVFGLLKLVEIYDSLTVQEQHNLELPSWTNNVFPVPMNKIILKIFDIGTHTHRMKQLKAGPLLKSITTDMKKKVDTEEFHQNLHFYSGHDSTLITIMITLNMFNEILPPYGSALIFELRERSQDEYLVTVLFKNITNEETPYLLEISSCGTYCTLNHFLNITEPFIVNNWEETCKKESSNDEEALETWPFTTSQTVSLIFVVSFLLSSMSYFAYQRNKHKFHILFNNMIEKSQ